MKRSFFVAAAAAASACAVSRPLLAGSQKPTKRMSAETNGHASGWGMPMWHCGSAVVWVNLATGIYYYKGDRWYGRTKPGAYTCEKQAIDAGNRANLSSSVFWR